MQPANRKCPKIMVEIGMIFLSKRFPFLQCTFPPTVDNTETISSNRNQIPKRATLLTNTVWLMGWNLSRPNTVALSEFYYPLALLVNEMTAIDIYIHVKLYFHTVIGKLVR